VEIRVIQRVHIRAQALAQRVRQFTLVRDQGNCRQVRANRLQPLCFNRCLIHIGIVEIGDFARV
jgi:hypothetical protein